MFTSFLFDKLSNLKQFYRTESDFIEHLQSGEVKIPVSDVIKYLDEYEKGLPELPSRFKHGDKVRLSFTCPTETQCTSGVITGIHFYPGKVKYDIEINIEGEHKTRIYNIDSAFVIPKN